MSNKTDVLRFDDWINVNGFNFRPEQYDLYKFLYEAGQKSKQDEVDELKRKLNEIVILVRDNTPDYYLDNMIDEILKGDSHES